MGNKQQNGSVGKAIIWMFFLSLFLFWLGPLGTLIAGIVGGKKAGGVGGAFAAVFLPSIVLGMLIFIMASSLSGLPIIGAAAGLGVGLMSLIGIGPLLLGAIIGGIMAPEPSNSQIPTDYSQSSHIKSHEKEKSKNSSDTTDYDQSVKQFNSETSLNYNLPSPPKFQNYESETDQGATGNDYDEYKTFLAPSGDDTIIVSDDYRSMKPLPGYLLVLNGEQANKRLKLYGRHTDSGTKLTIGRDSSDWKNKVPPQKQSTHLRIKDSSKTLSRLQAELIYKDGSMHLKNVGSVNPTQVNDLPIHPQSMVIIKSGMTIQAGYLLLRYVK